MMRTRKIVATGVLALLTLGFAACSSDEEDFGSVVQEVSLGTETSRFFDSQVRSMIEHYYYIGETPAVSVVNSAEDLRKILSEGRDADPEIQLPDIDFSKYSLVFGQESYRNWEGDKEPLNLKRQTLYKSDESYTLELQYTYQVIKTELNIQEFVRFWGIYPKLENMPIHVKLKFVEK